MNKQDFLKIMDCKEKKELISIYDKIKLADKTNKIIYTNKFYSPNIWKNIQKVSKHFDVNIYTYGIFQECERRIIAFSVSEVWEYPITLLSIKNKSSFTELKHKDYLGALMALGIDRSKFGDLIVKGNKCYVALYKNMVNYIKENLVSIGKCPCSINILDPYTNEIPQFDFQDIVINVSSVRIDCIVSSLCNISRNKANDLIKRGKVLLDYEKNFQKNTMPKKDSVITIRGYGKFKIGGEIGWTGRGRSKILIRKFI